MSRPSLPPKDSPEASALIELYLTCTSSVIDQLTREYGYKTRNNFVDAMREKFGARRKHIPDTPQDNTIENEVLVNKGKIHHLTTGKGIQDIVIINDTHIPYQDRISVMLTMRAIADIQPAYIILNGDIIDFYSISRFSVDPKRWLSIQDDLDDTREFLRQLKELSDAKIIFCAGNHEDRLKQYLWSRASELLMLRDLDIRQQLGLNIFDIDYADYDTVVRINNMFDVEHGDTVSKHSGWTAKAMWEKRGGCGICGHCLSEDTEILTPTGWQGIDQIEKGDIVGTFNLRTEAAEFQITQEKFVYNHYKEAIHIKGNSYDSLVTPEHTVYYKKKNGEWVSTEAQNLKIGRKNRQLLPLAAKTRERKDYPISDDWIAFVGWAVSEGCFSLCGKIDISQREGDYANEIESIINSLGLDYRKQYRCQKGNTYNFNGRVVTAKYDLIRFYFHKEATKKIRKIITEKRLPQWCYLLSDRQAEILFNALVKGDGTIHGKTSRIYYTSDKVLADQIQGLLALHGKTSSLSSDKRSGCSYRISWCDKWITRAEPNVTLVPYSGRMWCVSVPNGTLITRRNGKVMILGNSHRIGSYLKTFEKDTYGWWENGCLCSLDVEYIKSPNWQQGFSVVTFNKERFFTQQVPIIKHKFVFRGKLYE